MIADTYRILIEGVLYADKMNFDTAMILAEGLFHKYYKERELSIEIERYEDRGDRND